MRRIALVAAAVMVLATLAIGSHVTATEHTRFDSGPLEHNATFPWTFEEPGTYTYHCTPHPFMMGSVVVTEGASQSGTVEVDIIDLAYNPETIEVAPGTTVVWTQRDDASTAGPGGHTVTEDDDSPGPSGSGDDGGGGSSPGLGLVVSLAAVFAAVMAARRRQTF
jgi:plastocyanin